MTWQTRIQMKRNDDPQKHVEDDHQELDPKKLKAESTGPGKQTLIVHFFGEIPGFDELGSAMVRNSHGHINFVETVRRVVK